MYSKQICQLEPAKQQIPIQYQPWNVGFPCGVRLILAWFRDVIRGLFVTSCASAKQEEEAP